MVSAEREPIYSGGLGLWPPVGSRGTALSQGAKLPEADEILANKTPIFCVLKCAIEYIDTKHLNPKLLNRQVSLYFSTLI